jgi:hypothetical protein
VALLNHNSFSEDRQAQDLNGHFGSASEQDSHELILMQNTVADSKTIFEDL